MIYVWPPTELTDRRAEHARPARPADHGRARGWRRSQFLGPPARRGDRRADRDRRTDHSTTRATARTRRSAPPSTEPMQPLDDYRQKVLRGRPARQRLPVRADRPARRAGRPLHRVRPRRAPARWCRWTGRRARTPRRIVAGVVSTPTERYPEGVTRVVLLGDPTKALGALSEPECARVIAALDLAERMRVPLEWFALSAGARISMNSGTENMDWVAGRAQADRRVHPGRRRDQHRGRRHHRRRPAVLERRGDDAHAHQGHPGDDARTRRWC